jgi:hypothetical protein
LAADGRHAATPSRTKLLVVVGAIVVAAIAVAAVVVLAGGDTSLGGIVGPDEPETPEFAFERSKLTAVETAAKPNHKQAVISAREPAEAVTDQLDALYIAAFLDPANWLEGDYDDVLGFFTGGARDEAERRLDVLTAGPGAADAFDAIQPVVGGLRLHVLLDPGGVPRAVEGTARFIARGRGADGDVMMVSKGEFIFEKDDGEWLVMSFSVQRDDEAREPKPSASATAEPSEAEAT